MGCHEIILGESKQHVSFSYSAISDHKYFNEIVITLVFFHYKIYIFFFSKLVLHNGNNQEITIDCDCQLLIFLSLIKKA